MHSPLSVVYLLHPGREGEDFDLNLVHLSGLESNLPWWRYTFQGLRSIRGTGLDGSRISHDREWILRCSTFSSFFEIDIGYRRTVCEFDERPFRTGRTCVSSV